MAKGHVETKKVDEWFGGSHYEAHACRDELGKDAVTGYGRTADEARENALDRLAARSAGKT